MVYESAQKYSASSPGLTGRSSNPGVANDRTASACWMPTFAGMTAKEAGA
jgi:hypothetical protein